MSPRATILMYHRLSESVVYPKEAIYTVSPRDFREHLRILTEEGRPVVGLPHLLDGSYPDGAVVLTFDDGCKSDIEVALPALQERGFESAIFVNPATLGREGFLSWSDLETLRDAGMHVGSHGLDHRLLDDLSEEELERQLAESRRALEDRLRIEVTTLALPGGSGADRAPLVARRMGYRSILGSEPALAERRHASTLMPRFPVRRSDSKERIRGLVRQEILPRLSAKARYHAIRGVKAVLGRRLYGEVRRLGSSLRGSA